MPANAPLEVSLQLGNTSSTDKSVNLLVANFDGTGDFFCVFNVPANTPLQTYTVRGRISAAAHPDLRLFVDDANQPNLLVDNVSLQYRPSLSLTSTQCLPPAGALAIAEAEPRLVEAEGAVVQHSTSWLQQEDAANASGGAYLASSSADDPLTLHFTGTGITVVYVAGPTFGSFSVVLDGQTYPVDSCTDAFAFGQTLVLDDLAQEAHVLQIIPDGHGGGGRLPHHRW